ncbi:MAG: redoxin domain-containing protein [Candidatus Sumerlaeaceae bacterium]
MDTGTIRSFHFLLTVIAALSLLVNVSNAQVPTPSSTLAPITISVPAGSPGQPDAQKLLQSAAARLAGLSSCYLELTTTMSATVNGSERVQNASTRLWLQRPSKLVWMAQTGPASVSIISDGSQLLTYIPLLSQYTLEPLTGGVAPRLAEGMHSFGSLMSALFAADPTTSLTTLLSGVAVVGAEIVDGQPAQHLRATTPEGTTDVWLESTGQLPVRVVVSGKRNGMDVTQEIGLKWIANQHIPDAVFAISPPATATKVAAFDQRTLASAVQRAYAASAPPGAAGASMPMRDPPKLLGKAAPDFTVMGLDNRPFQLSSVLGKRVVILDFFATWCGPCRRSMPGVEQLAKRYAAQGVELYAVNQGETAAQVRQFLQQNKLSSNVLLDMNSAVGRAYQVGGIPHLVIIGKDGIVKAEHIGLPADPGPLLEPELKRAIGS